MSLVRKKVRCSRPGFVIDDVWVERIGTVRVRGWSTDAKAAQQIQVDLDGTPVSCLARYREWRPDVRRARASGDGFAGFVAEFRKPGLAQVREVSVRLGDEETVRIVGPFTFLEPHYAGLLDSTRVLSRSDIYASGPPPEAYNEPALDLALETPGSILDFGCGSGVYLRALRQRGRDVQGIELDTPWARASLKPDVLPYVRLYNGGYPLPLESGSFDSCIALEVLEHITAFRETVAELARIARKVVVFTVPDASAIPTLFPHYAVPWHLLEAGHVNFFTQSSLDALLRPFFREIEMARICPFDVNGTVAYTSIAATCRAA